jgi:hypothetical protein
MTAVKKGGESLSESRPRNRMAQADADGNGGPRPTSAEKKELAECG